jgi:very-short-patch-repair endonuclease
MAPVARLSNGHGCPYCATCARDAGCIHRSLEHRYPEIAKEWHPTKNDTKPSDISYASAKKITWICPKKHEYTMIICSRTLDRQGCPRCVNKTQDMLYELIKNNYEMLDVTTNVAFDWSKSQKSDKHYYRFDIVVSKMNIIIECDGDQHFRDVMNWKSAEDTRELDIYKMKKAIENGFTIIRILQDDVYSKLNDWEVKLDKAIRMYDHPSAVFIVNKDKYDKHIESFEKHITY